MRLPRRIFLNVVIFVSSFLVISYHKTAQSTCRVLQPKSFYSLIVAHPFKKKNKIFTSNCAVCSNTGGRFFRRRAGLLSGAHFCRSGAAGVGIHGTVFYRLYCYRRHSLPGSLFIQVVILHTIPGSRRWNPPHSLRRAGLLSAAQFGAVCIAGKKWLLSGAQFGTFSRRVGRLLSTATNLSFRLG